MPVRLRPLLVRPGARFECSGDGLCCADAHLLGPVSPREARAINAEHPGTVIKEQGLVVLRTQRDGTCTFLERSGACAIHASPARPRTCHRYPFLFVATPEGGRVSTDHRCPCRTMGARPPLRAELAEAALRDSAGRLSVDSRIEDQITIARGRAIPWETWRARERVMLERLASGARVEDVLDTAPFPEITDGSWLQIGVDLGDDDRPMRWTRANQWAGDAIAALHGEPLGPDRPRPWSDAFDRAEQRSPEIRDPEEMLADWIADVLWSLEWVLHGPLTRARADLATRVAIARWIAARMEAAGVRRDRAMAEAISIVEIVGLSDAWTSILERVRTR